VVYYLYETTEKRFLNYLKFADGGSVCSAQRYLPHGNNQRSENCRKANTHLQKKAARTKNNKEVQNLNN